MQTVRWRFYQTPGKIVRHADALYLKVAREVVGLFEAVRARCWQMAMAP